MLLRVLTFRTGVPVPRSKKAETYRMLPGRFVHGTSHTQADASLGACLELITLSYACRGPVLLLATKSSEIMLWPSGAFGMRSARG